MNFHNWINHFKNNKRTPEDIIWNETAGITEKELDTIAASIQVFQKGESSEARHLLNKVMKEADRLNCPELYTAYETFIKEEHRHSEELGRFMQIQGIPRLTREVSDDLFTFLRRAGNLEFTITILSTAELIATAYYRALGKATNSRLLKQICNCILRDEDQHLAFQAYCLSLYYRNRPAYSNKIIKEIQRVMAFAATTLVWLTHNKVMKKGYTFLSFWKKTNTEFNKMHELIKAESFQISFT